MIETLNAILLLALALPAVCALCHRRVRRLSGAGWTVKRRVHRYLLCAASGAELSISFADFSRARGEHTAGGIGAVRAAALRFFDSAALQDADRAFDELMEIANLTDNIAARAGKRHRSARQFHPIRHLGQRTK